MGQPGESRRPFRALLVAILALGCWYAVPAAAVADTEVDITHDGARQFQPYQAWADAMFTPEPPGLIDLRLLQCPWLRDAGGCMDDANSHEAEFDPETHAIVIYLAENGRNRRTFTHELGHAFEVLARPSAAIKAELLDLFGLRHWRTVARERFAEAYSLCARFRRIHHPVSTRYFGYRATPRSHKRACALIGLTGHEWERRHRDHDPRAAPESTEGDTTVVGVRLP